VSRGEPVLPCNLDAERYVLGSILLNGERYTTIAGALDNQDFSLEKHKRIFARIAELYQRGENIDRVTLANELARQGQLESVDGLSYLVSLDEGLPEIPNLDSYIRIVKDKALLRTLMFECQKIIRQCALGSESAPELLEMAASVVETVRAKDRSSEAAWETPGAILRQGVEAVLFPAQSSVGLKTPWPRLTEMTCGWKPGDLIVVGGRTSMGKSVVAMQQALTSASQGLGVAYFSLEMSKVALVRRLIAGISRVDAHRARSGALNEAERGRMLEAAADLDELPLFIDQSRAHTPAAVSIALRKLRAKHPVDLVVIDHLQLMKVSGRAESRHQELSEICHGFKRLAGEMNCSVVLLSQLSRVCEVEKRRPKLSDLKESGSIEEDADTVIFIHRPEMYKRDDPSLRGQAELIVAKQREGPIGKLAMTFLHGFQIFEESTGEVEEDAE
jgi:replicative DNA helicase